MTLFLIVLTVKANEFIECNFENSAQRNTVGTLIFQWRAKRRIVPSIWHLYY
ncbi:hypothetical protein TDB9533_03711 [Thalassocella blandensis]|nr:hypothetical protein TDB9533_03711 [Thalassocella blandensis]